MPLPPDYVREDASALPLGEGAFAVVRMGIVCDIKTNKWVPAALKVFKSADQTESAKREAAAMADLDHPNILKVFGYTVQADGRAVIAMELLPKGCSLSELLLGETPLSLADKVRIVREIASALAYCASKGVTHADLKPENVLMTADGVCKLADFGLAKKVSDEGDAAAAGGGGFGAGTFMLCGTLQYMAPEVFTNTAHRSPEIDVYALGIVMWCVFSRKAPYYDMIADFSPPSPTQATSSFTKATLVKVGLFIQGGVRPDMNKLELDTPGGVKALMTGCWAHTVAQRPTASSVGAAFSSFQALQATQYVAAEGAEGDDASAFLSARASAEAMVLARQEKASKQRQNDLNG